jgi:CRISPR-associated protein Cas8c/Csd1 subtype I-C
MILRRLYELAVREHLLDDLAFEEMPVPFVILVGANGKYLGIEERRGTITIPSKKKGEPPKTRQDKGKPLSVPRPHGNTANPGFARYFVDTLARVLPVTADDKSARSRQTFWEQISRASEETSDPALRDVMLFGRALRDETDLAAKVRADVERLEPGASDRCTFAWEPDAGKTLLDREPVGDWYRTFFETKTLLKQQSGPIGLCQVTGTVGPMPTTHPIRLSGIPGGLPTGVSIVSYDKAAFESYGLEGTANARIGYAAADGYLRALTALIGNKLQGNPPSSLRVGDIVFLFWTRQRADTGFMSLLDNPDPAEVQKLFHSASAGKEYQGLTDENDFYLLGLSGNSARAIVRDYLEERLPRVRANLARWFRELRIADLSREGLGKPSCRFALWQLALATALDMDQVAPETPSRLLLTALKGDPVPESLLVACLRRLRAEGAAGFRPARMGLVKLILLRRNIPVTETLSPDEKHPAYLYGRLLAVFEQIQYAALGDVNANVVDKFYGTFSAAPALVFSRLFSNAQNHLRKLRSEKPGAFVNLDRLLTEVSKLLPASPPRGQLSLQDQGRFALGYYHQRAKRYEDFADRKAKEAKAEQAAG